MGHRTAIAEVMGEDLEFLAGGHPRVRPKERLDLAPGKEVGVDDLVGVASQDEGARGFERPQDESQLHRRQILDLIDHDEVITGLHLPVPGVGHQVEIIEALLGQPGLIAEEEVIDQVPLFRREDGLTHAQGPVRRAIEYPVGTGRDHSPDLFESLMRIDTLVVLTDPREPAGEVAPVGFATRGNLPGLQIFPIRQKGGFLIVPDEAVGVIEFPRMLGQIGGVGDVQHLARNGLELFQQEGGLAASGAAHQDQRRQGHIQGVLGIIEGQRLVQHVNGRARFREKTQGLCLLARFFQVCGDDLTGINVSAAQETRLGVVVLPDDLQHQDGRLFTMAHQRKEQAIGIIEPRPIKLAISEMLQFLDLRRAEIPLCQGLGYLGVGTLHAVGVESGVGQNAHRAHVLNAWF